MRPCSAWAASLAKKKALPTCLCKHRPVCQSVHKGRDQPRREERAGRQRKRAINEDGGCKAPLCGIKFGNAGQNTKRRTCSRLCLRVLRYAIGTVRRSLQQGSARGAVVERPSLVGGMDVRWALVDYRRRRPRGKSERARERRQKLVS
jgi:hypothetical protein